MQNTIVMRVIVGIKTIRIMKVNGACKRTKLNQLEWFSDFRSGNDVVESLCFVVESRHGAWVRLHESPLQRVVGNKLASIGMFPSLSIYG
ncbi:hypothetical protein Hanom_Chr12g01075221 [Helianthus anomalus]